MPARSRDHNISVERKLKLVPHKHDDPMLTKSNGHVKNWLWVGSVAILVSLTIYLSFGFTKILNWFASLI